MTRSIGQGRGTRAADASCNCQRHCASDVVAIDRDVADKDDKDQVVHVVNVAVADQDRTRLESLVE